MGPFTGTTAHRSTPEKKRRPLQSQAERCHVSAEEELEVAVKRKAGTIRPETRHPL